MIDHITLGDVYALSNGDYLCIDFINGPTTGATFYNSASQGAWSHPPCAVSYLTHYKAEKIGTVKLKPTAKRGDVILAMAKVIAKRKRTAQ